MWCGVLLVEWEVEEGGGTLFFFDRGGFMDVVMGDW